MDFPIWLTILLVVGLLTFSALLSLAETVSHAASRARLLQLEKNGEKRAGILDRLNEERERVIGSLLRATMSPTSSRPR